MEIRPSPTTSQGSNNDLDGVFKVLDEILWDDEMNCDSDDDMCYNFILPTNNEVNLLPNFETDQQKDCDNENNSVTLNIPLSTIEDELDKYMECENDDRLCTNIVVDADEDVNEQPKSHEVCMLDMSQIADLINTHTPTLEQSQRRQTSSDCSTCSTNTSCSTCNSCDTCTTCSTCRSQSSNVTMSSINSSMASESISDSPVDTVAVQASSMLPQEGCGADSSQLNSDEAEIEFQVIDEQPWRTNNTFHSMTKLLRARLNNNLSNTVDIARLSQTIDTAYERFVSQLIEDASDNDRIFITFRNPQENRELYVSFLKKNFKPQEFLDRAYALAQSAGNFLDDSVLEIKIQIVKCISGGSKARVSKLLTGPERARRKRSVYEIINDDYKCGYLAIAAGKAYVDEVILKGNKVYWKNLKQSKNRLTALAANLFMDMPIDASGPLNIQKISDIQSLIPTYQIIVVDQRTQLKLYAGLETQNKIILEYSEPPHFNLITSMTGYMDCDEFCFNCWLKVDKISHVCKGSCKQCHAIKSCKLDEIITCSECNVDLNSRQCYDQHITNGVCGRIIKCKQCWVTFDATNGDHVCDIYKCNFCDVGYRASPHYCHIKPSNLEQMKKEDSKPWILICYDIESMQVSYDGVTNTTLQHQPNLLISKTMCTNCMDNSTLSRSQPECIVCGKDEHVWYGVRCVEDFCDYLYNEMLPRTTPEVDSRSAIQIKVIAHNQRGYDGHFIMQDFFKRKFLLLPNIIMSGSKILYSQMENIKFIDSLSLFMQPLSSLCKSFNIKEMKKGYFPHKFNMPENQNYIGSFPSIEFYEPQLLKPSQKTEFEEWYNRTVSDNPIFDFKKEITDYCRSDVMILQAAVMKFIGLFMKITGLNPITRSFTLASVAMEVFRAHMLPPFTLGITPIAGYSERKQSIKANAWLDSMQRSFGKNIKKEWRLGPFYADGFIPECKTVFEFWGCYFHGCTVCYPDRTTMVTFGDEQVNVEILYRKVILKKEYYQHRGYLLHETWEHDFDIRENYAKTRIHHYERIKYSGPIDIRESFYGGRTNNIKFFHECSPDEVIRYLDFTSLYPFVLREYAYPLGHPTLIQEDFKDINSYFGFVKCKVLPPTKLNIGVLPMRVSKKLLFPLCLRCANESNKSSCNHSTTDRAMTSTWTTIELQEAVIYGYKILEIYQVLDYKHSHHSSSLFSEYIKMWLKIKQESSDWPSWVQNDNDKEKYIAEYKAAEGIDLDPIAIEKNPGRRSIAKLMLNSFWGKLAQSANMPKTKFVRNYADLWGIISDEDNEVMGIHEASDDVIMVQHRYVETAKEKIVPGKTNIAVASFVTAYARRELFRLIQRIENHRRGRVLYFDTDSVVFVEKRGDPVISCGDYLGQLTDEIEPGWKCNLFVSLGPKNYAYQVISDTGDLKSIIKVKGIRLTSKALNIITIQKLLDMANQYIGGDQQKLLVDQSNIIANKFTHNVETKSFEKIYRAVSEKRRIIGNDTRPFGYVD